MSKQAKLIAVSVLALCLLILGAFLCWRVFSPAPQPGDKTIAVTVTHGDGSVRELTISTDAEYLWDAMDEQGLIDGADSEFGKWVTAVDGETADESASMYWMFTRGGEWVDTSCDTTPIADGEAYEFFIYEYAG